MLCTKCWDLEQPCTYRSVSLALWLDAQAVSRLLRAIRLQGKHSVWLCIPIRTSPFAAGVKFLCKMPTNLLEELPPRSD